MSEFVDPLTLASENADNSSNEDPVPDVKLEEDDEDEEDIFDAEGRTEIKEEEEEVKNTTEPTDETEEKVGKKKSSEEFIFDDQQDLFISVDRPDKVILSMETFISYRVVTKEIEMNFYHHYISLTRFITNQTTRSSFDDCEYEVQRRYQDFVWLRGKLEDSHPTHLIPPLPSKFVVKGMVDRFSSDFVTTRCRALDSFLKRIAEHPVISCNDHLKSFLTTKAEDFTVHRKQSKPGLLSRVGGSVKSAASVGSSLRSKVRDPEFSKMADHVSTFREQMCVTDRVAERLLVEEKELCNDLKDYSPTYASWAVTETEVLSPIMTSLSKCIESCTESAVKNASSHELYFIPPLKEYQLYCDCVDQVLKRRDVMQGQRDKCAEELKRKNEEKENLPHSDQSYSLGAMMGRKPDEVRQQKEEKLNQQIEEVTKRYEDLSDKLERANGDLRSDMERWKFNKKQDMKQVFSQLADSHITFQSQCLATWESLIPLMQGKINFEDMVSEGNDLSQDHDLENKEEKTTITNENAEET